MVDDQRIVALATIDREGLTPLRLQDEAALGGVVAKLVGHARSSLAVPVRPIWRAGARTSIP